MDGWRVPAVQMRVLMDRRLSMGNGGGERWRQWGNAEGKKQINVVLGGVLG